MLRSNCEFFASLAIWRSQSQLIGGKLAADDFVDCVRLRELEALAKSAFWRRCPINCDWTKRTEPKRKVQLHKFSERNFHCHHG